MKRLVAGVVFVSFGVSVSALHIVGWSATRGGISSITTANGYASTRAAIQLAYPGTTFGTTSTLSETSLAGADVVWIGSTFGQTTAISALTSAEQSALLAFVQAGGRALVFADNDTFSGSAQAVNNSLMSVFGCATIGTLGANQQHNFLNTTAYPAVGAGGTCSQLVSGFPGWFASYPSHFAPVTRLQTNNQVSCLTSPPGGVSSGSGRVWLISDTGSIGTGGTENTNWNTLFVNMLSEYSRVSGQFQLNDWVGDTSTLTATIKVWSGSTMVQTIPNVPLSATGTYQVTIPRYGNYELSGEVSHWLGRRTSVLVQDGATANFVLPNGDSDESGEVDAADIDLIIANFGGSALAADLDGSGEVDAADIDIAIANFGTTDE